MSLELVILFGEDQTFSFKGPIVKLRPEVNDMLPAYALFEAPQF
jgi:hypothetical protein